MTPTYHHGRLREALLDAAVASVRERGPEGLAIRDLARRVGVSHNAAYRHFADRDALVEAVAEHAMTGLAAAMRARSERVDEADPVVRARRRLCALGAGYVDFAAAEAGLFRVLFTTYPDRPEGVGTPGGDTPVAGRSAVPHEPPAAADDDGGPFGMLVAALDELVAVGSLDPALREGADLTCWAAVHGFAALVVEGPLRHLPAPERDATLWSMLANIDRSYAATPAAADRAVDGSTIAP